MSDEGETWEFNELGEAEVTRLCEGCGEGHTVRLLDQGEHAVMLYIRKDGKGRISGSMPPHMIIGAVMGFLEQFAEDKGLSVRDAVKRARIEASHGPFGMPSEN